MKGNKMQITKLTNNIYRLVLGTNESDIFYIAKGFKGVWKIAQQGQVIDFAPTRQSAINLAINLHNKVTA
jgi:hypothetical protein